MEGVSIYRGYLLFCGDIKYFSSSVLKTSEFSRVRSTNENFDVLNSRDEICLVFTKKSKFSFYFILSLEDLQLISLLTMLQAESQ